MDRDGPDRERKPRQGEGVGQGEGRARCVPVVLLEVLSLLMFVLGVGGTCALLIAAHWRVGKDEPPAAVVAMPASGTGTANGSDEEAPPPEVALVPEPEPEPVPEPEPEPEPAVPQVDLTAEALAELDARRARLAEQVDRVSQRVAAIGGSLKEAGRQIEAFLAEAREADRRRLRLAAEAEQLEAELQLVALERDVLERQKDQAEAARRQKIERPGYAILPYRGPSGTWRRPIPVECRNGMAVMEPGGMSFSMIELAAMPGRSGPFGAAVKRLAFLLEREGAPGGERVEPYVLFVVRPDGIRPFYEARSSLDAIGIPYGYELVDQDWEIEYPAWDDPTIWASLDASLQADPPIEDTATGGDPGLAGFVGDGGFGGFGDQDGLGRSGSLGVPSYPGGAAIAEDMRSLADLMPEGPIGLPGDPGIGSGLGRRGPGAGGRSGDPGFGSGGSGAASPGGQSSISPAELEELIAEGTRSRGTWSSIVEPEVPGLDGMPGGETGGVDSRIAAGSGLAGRPGIGGRGSAAAIGGRGVPGGGGGTGLGWQDGEPGAGRPGLPVPGLEELLGFGGQAEGRADGEAGAALGDPIGSGAGAGLPSGEPNPSDPLAGGASRPASGNGNEGASGDSASPISGQALGSGSGFGSAGGFGRRRIEVVVASGRKGVTIHPGGYRLSEETVKDDDGRLVQAIEAVAASERRKQPASDPVPTVRFLVEPGGYGLYWSARSQVELAKPEWPITWQASEPRTFSLFGSERW
ncbi:hypothetical protein [Tautonia rosea]|uniref:hypothetical protein n=1 Tax=Tautonia rosea TaxID=2728037 RepID=UPI0014742DF0|nr:hypothetical protein [Tautonia rosea]